jgi:alpha-D-ribose 1-methylphosphonate 5-triphosphate diphosphatase PhnM
VGHLLTRICLLPGSVSTSAGRFAHLNAQDILETDYYPVAILHTAFKLAREGVMPLYESIRLASTNAPMS